MSKLISEKFKKNQIDALCKYLNQHEEINVKDLKGEYEVFRGNYKQMSIILYSSGKMTFLPNKGFEKILESFKISVISEQITSEDNLDPFELNVRLTTPQIKSLQLELEKIDQIIKFESNSQYEVARYKLEGKSITLYTKGTVYSPNGLTIFRDFILKAVQKHPTNPDVDIIIGQDEVGKGELFGPLVIGSVALNQTQIVELQLAGVKDSKDLNPTKIKNLYDMIKKNSIATKAITIHADRFNSLLIEVKNENKNLNDLLAWGHSIAFSELQKILKERKLKDKNTKLIIDEFSRIKTDYRIKKLLTPNIMVEQTFHGEDASISVAAASILAKETRNLELKDLESKINLNITETNLPQIMRSPYANKIVKFQYLESRLARGSLYLKEVVKGQEAEEHISKIKDELEAHRIDFKIQFPSTTQKIGKLLSAFANHDGGEIYFGIEDETRSIVGVQNPQKLEERISGCRKNCDPSPILQFTIYELKNGVKILGVHITASKIAVAYLGRYYYRDVNSSETRTLTSLEIDNFPNPSPMRNP